MGDLIKSDTKDKTELDKLLTGITRAAAPVYADVLLDVAAGDTMAEACSKHGTSVGAVLGMVVKVPEIGEAYKIAKQIKLEGEAEKLITLADSIDPDDKTASNQIKKASLQIETRKWLLARLVANYKEKQQIDVNVSVDLADRLSSGVARVEKEIKGKHCIDEQ